jgi:hypothetical protein
MWYIVQDVMAILDVGQTTAYTAMRLLADEIESTNIPGTDRTYARPPRGKIQRDYFCASHGLDRKLCDKIAADAKALRKSDMLAA